MNISTRITLSLFLLVASVSFQKYRQISKSYPVPKLDLDEYWGPGDKANYTEDINLIGNRIYYPDEVIEELKQDLNRTIEFRKPLEGVGFEYGFNTNKLQDVIKYWRDEYLPKWRQRELYLWRWPHFTTYIQGLRIHYLHTKFDDPPNGKKVYPIILLHGWPGSVLEFYDLLPYLVDNDESAYAFELVVPSLPGFAWSQGASKPGLGAVEMAVIFRNLMLRLGYTKFYIQGGNWGSVIGSNIATLFPENVIGYHSNLCGITTPMAFIKEFIGGYYPSLFIPKEYQDFVYPMSAKFSFLLEEMGYCHLQATKPDTIGAALTDNPIGLAAYILEKFSTWTNRDYRKLADGGLDKKFKLTRLLDNVMLYYLTNSITTSQRIYAESFSARSFAYEIDRVPTAVPTACARFKQDLSHQIDWALKDKYTNLIQSTYYKEGGDFIAFESAKVLYDDFIQFVAKVEKL